MALSSASQVLLSTTRAAQFAIRAARMTESILLFVTTFGLILACAVYSSGESIRAQELVVALVCALLSAATWWWPRRLGEQAVAQRLDRKLNLDGAYLTAWEVESGRLGSNPLSRLLAARVSSRLRGEQAIRTSLPNSAPWIAAPFLAGAVLALALAEVRSEHENSNSATATRALASVLGDLRLDAAREEGLSEEALAAIDTLLEEARALAALDGSELAESDDRMSQLSAELEQLAADSPSDSTLRQGLQESQILADQARMTLAESLAEAELAEVSAKPGASTGSEVASGAGPGTMLGAPTSAAEPEPGSAHRTIQTESENAPNSAGVFSRGRWWPSRHDQLVSSWVEARRELD